MPLSPEDVVEKRFNPTRVREGYAQDEVDDFLDEVVAELRRLHEENAELRGQLTQCQTRVTELSRAGATPAPAETVDLAKPAPAEVQPVAQTPGQPETPVQPETPAQPEVVAAQDPSEKAAGVIALAQRLHDEYVRDGETQRDALIAGAQEQAATVVAEAEARRDHTLGELESRRRQLDDQIHLLHGRETSYREQLESYIVTQLEDLRRAGRVVPDDAVSH